MLLPWEIKCNMTRNPARSILIACVSALMVCGMALYLRNIQITEEALDGLAEQMPVVVRVTNRDASLYTDLKIKEQDVDFLLKNGVRNPLYTAVFTGILPDGSQMLIHGANTLEAVDGLNPRDFTFLEGWDETFLESGQPVFAMQRSLAEKSGLHLGDTVSAELFFMDKERAKLPSVGVHSVTLAATFEDAGKWTALMPMDWLREITDEASPEDSPIFACDSFRGILAEPRELNTFKAAAKEWGFWQRNAVAAPDSVGDTLSIEDEMYIKTGGEMVENLNLYRTFLLPFFGLVTLIVAMVTFLAMRSCRRQIALASSLGRQKLQNAAAHFCSAVIVQLAGCLLALGVLSWAISLLPMLAGITLGAFSLCALSGSALALLFLFRFDTLTMLTKND